MSSDRPAEAGATYLGRRDASGFTFDALRAAVGFPRSAMDESTYSSTVEALRDACGQAEFDLAWSEGTAMTHEEAVAIELLTVSG